SGCLSAVGGVALGLSRRRGLVRLGLDLMVAGLVLLLLMPAGRAIVGMLPHDQLARQAAAGLWDAFFSALRTWGLVLAGIGIVFQAAGRSLLARFDPHA